MRDSEQRWHQPGVTQQDKDCLARSRQQISLPVSTSHPVLQHQATQSTSLCKMLPPAAWHRQLGETPLCTETLCHQNQNVSFCPAALQSSGNCTLTVFLPSSRAFCLPHSSGKALKLACAVLQQTVECFFRDLSPGQGSWVLQQWNSLSPWLATPLDTALHLALTKANTYNSPKTSTGVTVRSVVTILG